MAHANNSPITGKFRGSPGKELVFREWDGNTVVAKSRKSRSGDPTDVQAEIQEKFLVAPLRKVHHENIGSWSGFLFLSFLK